MTNPFTRDPHEYVVAFQQGKEQGFTYFFTSLYPALVYYAGRILNDRAAAEDVVEESFIKIWERHSNFTHPNVIRSWLYTTVRNACITRLQQEERNHVKKEQLVSLYENSHENSVLHDIIRAEVISEVHAYIESLPTECRKIFKLLYIQGKTVRETAKELRLSVSTIKNQKARGLMLLRNRFPDISTLLLLYTMCPN